METSRLTSNSIRSASLRLCWSSFTVLYITVVAHSSFSHPLITDVPTGPIQSNLFISSLNSSYSSHVKWSWPIIVSLCCLEVPPKVLLSSQEWHLPLFMQAAILHSHLSTFLPCHHYFFKQLPLQNSTL